MRGKIALYALLSCIVFNTTAQVDTTYVYRTGLPYGTLDIRIRKSATTYYYLQENKTVAFRESSPGVKTNTYRDMTSWDSSPYGEGNLREKSGTSDKFIMNYRLLPPLNYNTSYKPGYPLIVFLHGAGERGNCWNSTCHFADSKWNPNTNSPSAPTDPSSKLLNNDHNLLHGGSTHLTMRNNAGGKLPNDPALSSRAFPGFVLFPQTMNGWTGTTVQDAIRLVRLIAKKYNIDEDRIYIEGLSQGGYAVYEAIKRAPWLFASVTTMSAVSDASITNQNYQSKIAHIPLWTFQGGLDSNPTPAKTEGYVKKFRDAGMVVKYTLYPELGHGTWNKAFSEGDFFKWILSQSKAKIHTPGGTTALCNASQGLKMQLSEGFRAYQWEKNGVIIPGATSASYVATTTGTYRARFSRKPNPSASDWNTWSPALTITSSNLPKPVVSQIGTVLLNDLNNFADAKLVAVTKAEKYYWYKNGSKLSFADTTTHPTIKASSGNGAYTLVTATIGGCASPPSDPKYIFFGNSAPINITAPATFSGTVQTGNSVKLTWTNSSGNETGFEIWRRKAFSSSSFSKWEMRTLTAANATTFTDTKLDPSSTYHYKIRAVSNSGRSNYTPAASNAYVIVKTNGDTAPPTAPQSLSAQAAAISTIALKWNASTDNSGIKQYKIYYGSNVVSTGSNATSYTLRDLPINTSYTFTVKAEDLGGNIGAASNSAAANTYVTGLYYEHSTGSWTDLDQVNWTAPAEFRGKVTTFTLSPRTQEDYFNFEFDGYLYINTAGTYYFQTVSSDGSRITLNGVDIVNNDGIHGNRTITSAAQSLSAGAKRINVKYFEHDESHSLTVRYKGPDTGNSYVTIPASALKSGNAPSGRTETNEDPVMVTENAEVDVYPNPTHANDINVQLTGPDNADVNIQVLDLAGKQLYNRQFSAAEVNNTVRLDAQPMNDGMYVLIVEQNGSVIKKRLVIKN